MSLMMLLVTANPSSSSKSASLLKKVHAIQCFTKVTHTIPISKKIKTVVDLS